MLTGYLTGVIVTIVVLIWYNFANGYVKRKMTANSKLDIPHVITALLLFGLTWPVFVIFVGYRVQKQFRVYLKLIKYLRQVKRDEKGVSE